MTTFLPGIDATVPVPLSIDVAGAKGPIKVKFTAHYKRLTVDQIKRLKERHVFLQDYESLNQLMLQESNWGQNDPECRHRCYLGCYLEVDEYLHHPLGLLKEPAMRRWMLGPIRNLGGRYKAESRGS